MKKVIFGLVCMCLLLSGCSTLSDKYVTKEEFNTNNEKVYSKIEELKNQEDKIILPSFDPIGNLLGGKQGGKYYCVDESIKIPGQNTYLLEGYYISNTGPNYQTLTVPSSRVEERVGAYGCLVALIREGYCSEIQYTTGSISVGYGNIGSNFSEKSLEDNTTRNGYYYYCEDLTEEQKYNMKYKASNIKTPTVSE